MSYTYKRSGTILLHLDDLDDIAGDVDTVTADLRVADRTGKLADPNQDAVASFTVTARAAAGDTPAGWDLTISAEAAEAIDPGSYIADARFLFNSGYEPLTDSVQVRVIEPATVRNA